MSKTKRGNKMRKAILLLVLLVVWTGGAIYCFNTYINPPKAIAYTVEVQREFDVERAIAARNPSIDPIIRSAIAESINKHSKNMGLDSVLVTAVIDKESEFNPMAKNKNDDGTIDRGLMMINEHHQKDRIKKHGLSLSDLFHIDSNIKLGCEFLKEKLTEEPDIKKAIQAYNSKKRQGYGDSVLSIYGEMVIKRG
jgi:soluble lytic murein transglycosylase-like protein